MQEIIKMKFSLLEMAKLFFTSLCVVDFTSHVTGPTVCAGNDSYFKLFFPFIQN
jgi:hypothetical protein